MNINDVIEELLLFFHTALTLNQPARQGAIIQFESTIGFSLPGDYKELLGRFNGISLMGKIVYGVGEEAGAISIDRYYNMEHEEVSNPMPPYLIPFSPDGYGSHYCFNSRTINNETCDVVFWQHDYPYSEEDSPEVANGSFTESGG